MENDGTSLVYLGARGQTVQLKLRFLELVRHPLVGACSSVVSCVCNVDLGSIFNNRCNALAYLVGHTCRISEAPAAHRRSAAPRNTLIL